MFRLVRYPLVLAIAAWLAVPALAQDGSRVQLEIQRTDDRIAQATSIVTGSGNERAETALANANSLQAAAKRAFDASQFAVALRSTMDARLRADGAIAIIRGQPDPERVQSQVERTRDLLERARPRIDECSDNRARALLRGAIEMQERAENAFEAQRGLAALRLTMSARERGWRALRLCHLSDDPGESAERALRRTDELLDRARHQIEEEGSGGARVDEAFRLATDLQSRAWAEFRAGHQDAALRLTQLARDAGHRALVLAGVRPPKSPRDRPGPPRDRPGPPHDRP